MLTLFGERYDVKVYETLSQLCPPASCRSTAGNIDRVGLRALLSDSARVFKEIASPYDATVDPASYVDQTAASQSGDTGKPLDPKFRFDQLRLNQPSRFNDFVAGIQATDRPTFHFLHLLLPPRALALPALRQRVRLQVPRARVQERPDPQPRSSSWPTSATCCSWPTPTGWSARWWPDSRPRACGTSRWW